MLDVYSSGILKKSENSTLLRWSSLFGNPRAKDMNFRLLAFQIFPMIRWGTESDPPYPKHLPNTKNPVRAYSRCHAPFLHLFLAPPTPPKVRTNLKKIFFLHSWVPRLPGKHSRLILIYASSFLHFLKRGCFSKN